MGTTGRESGAIIGSILVCWYRLPWARGWESNPSGGLILRKLLILRNSKMEKNHKNAEVRYTAGTRNNRRTLAIPTRRVRTPVSAQKELDQLRDANRRTALVVA